MQSKSPNYQNEPIFSKISSLSPEKEPQLENEGLSFNILKALAGIPKAPLSWLTQDISFSSLTVVSKSTVESKSK